MYKKKPNSIIHASLYSTVPVMAFRRHADHHLCANYSTCCELLLLRTSQIPGEEKGYQFFCNDVKYYIPSFVDSILEAMLTVSPNKQYGGIVVPTTPATTGPDKINKVLYHIFGSNAVKKLRFCFKFSLVNAHIYFSMHLHLL